MSEIVVGEPVGEPVRADGCDGAQGRAEPFGPLGKGERLALEDVGSGVLEGYCHAGRAPERAYGGSVVGQALAAAYRSVDDDRSVHSCTPISCEPSRRNAPYATNPTRCATGAATPCVR